MLTDWIIDKLVLLFDEDQKKALEFKQGNREMTLKKQIKYYFGDQYTFTNDEEKFLDGFALNIQKNISTIYKIGNLKVYSEKLADAKQFTKVNFTMTDNSTNNNKKAFSSNTSMKEFLKHSRNSSGTTERSDDWSGIEEFYTLKNKEILKSDINIDMKTIGQLPEAEDTNKQRDISKTPTNNLKIKQELTEPLDIDKKIEEQKQEIREMPPWNTIVSGSDALKTRNTDISNNDSIENNNSYSDGKNLGINFSTADNISKSIEADLYDLRSAFWNSFSHLFQDCFPCH